MEELPPLTESPRLPGHPTKKEEREGVHVLFVGEVRNTLRAVVPLRKLRGPFDLRGGGGDPLLA